MSLNISLDRSASPRRTGGNLRLWLGWVRVLLIAALSAGLWGALLVYLYWAVSRF